MTADTVEQTSSIKCSAASLCSFTRQVEVLVKAGVPLHETFEFMDRAGDDEICKVVAPALAQHLMRGRNLSTALSMFPRVFPRSYVVIIQAAEQTGRLAEALGRTSDLLDRQLQLKRHISKAVSYPVIVGIVSFVLTLILFNTVVPSILDTVLSLGGKLPPPTAILLVVVRVLQQPISWLFFAGLAISGFTYVQNPAQRETALRVLGRLPVVGKILLISANSQYCQTLSLLLSSGIEVTKACRISAQSSGSPLLADDSTRVDKMLKSGECLSEIFRSSKLYPPLVAEMAEIGEEAGKVPELLKRCGDIFESDTYDRVSWFVQLLEPVMLTVVAMGVGFILVSIILPLLALTASI